MRGAGTGPGQTAQLCTQRAVTFASAFGGDGKSRRLRQTREPALCWALRGRAAYRAERPAEPTATVQVERNPRTRAPELLQRKYRRAPYLHPCLTGPLVSRCLCYTRCQGRVRAQQCRSARQRLDCRIDVGGRDIIIRKGGCVVVWMGRRTCARLWCRGRATRAIGRRSMARARLCGAPTSRVAWQRWRMASAPRLSRATASRSWVRPGLPNGLCCGARARPGLAGLKSA